MPQPQHLQQQQQPQNTQQQQQQQNGPFYPALYLYPLNDSFVPKQISLAPQNGRVKIGRQTNAKTVPGERNGYFDSKVLSRQHAEIWEEGGKIFIKDVKSSNGTFINGERLSQEGVESEPFELKTGDTVEFGIDIVGEDNKTIIHHKVAANVVCILTPEDLASIPMHHGGPNARRGMGSQLQANQAQNAALGGMGGGAPRAGKSGLTFDHILSRLQTELAKSRETGGELQSLTGALVDVQDTLGGALPSNLPPYPSTLPPVRPPPAQTAEQAAGPAARAVSPPVDPSQLTNLQTQLHDTQSTLQQHLDKIRHLETYVNEQESIKREVTFIKDQMEERKREVEILLMQRRREEDGKVFSRRRELEDDDDDARSVATVTPDDYSDDEEDRRRRREELDRPRTPEPTGHLADEDYEDERRRQAELTTSQPSTSTIAAAAAPQPDLSEIFSQNALLTTRLETLTQQLDSAMELSRTLQSQAQLAQSTIAVLEAKVGSLEAAVQEQRDKATAAATSSPVETQPQLPAEPTPPAEPSVSKSIWDAWRDTMEVEWKTERETWQSERERLAGAVKEWEKRTVELERKEDERTKKEEERRSGFDGSSEGEESDESDAEGASRGDEDERAVPNGAAAGFASKKRKAGGGRRRKAGQLANGVLPSPMSSPTSSASFDRSSRSQHTRRSTSPSSVEPLGSDPSHSLMNGKLPLSPPNTSPRSRPESLAAGPVEDLSSQTEGSTETESGAAAGGLGLLNGAGGAQFKAAATNGNPPSFVDSAQMFAQRNGVGSNGAPGVKQMFGDIVSRLFGFLVAVVGMGLFVWTVADVASLLFFSPPSSSSSSDRFAFLRGLVDWIWVGFDWDSASTRSVSPPSSSTSNNLPAPSSFLMATGIPPLFFQPLPYTLAATTVILAAAAAAVYGQNQLRI
ncbi:hypothetical protein FRB90_005032 [Tulasnella sp. 427]|nr:hypothetical protein FRB90_005032 [Tulasnella sp. 427]